MGNEFGQLREWDEKREQDWMLLDYPIHSGFARFMKDLNEIYLTHSALWEKITRQTVSGGLTATRNRPASMYWNGAAKRTPYCSL